MPAVLPDYSHEDELRRLGFERIAGVDEAGRGALAGPVVAAAVLLPEGCVLPGVRDSKLVPEPEREQLYHLVAESALAWSVGIVENGTIDRINILQATFQAMRAAVGSLAVRPDYVLVDGRDVIATGHPCRAIIDGDALSVTIAAASLIAKVTRDRIMRDLHDTLPHYGFHRHKGYGTPEHRRAILQHGPAGVHRMSFLGKLLRERPGL
ncbi:MAG: ribonuclease HII [Bacteroidetes bacterium]|nr:ribonuclease HII [Bacteroidota bacterium]